MRIRLLGSLASCVVAMSACGSKVLTLDSDDAAHPGAGNVDGSAPGPLDPSTNAAERLDWDRAWSLVAPRPTDRTIVHGWEASTDDTWFVTADFGGWLPDDHDTALSDSAVLRWDGKSEARVMFRLPSRDYDHWLWAIAGASERDVWAVGTGAAVHFDGVTWTSFADIAAFNLRTLKRCDDGYFVGQHDELGNVRAVRFRADGANVSDLGALRQETLDVGCRTGGGWNELRIDEARTSFFVVAHPSPSGASIVGPVQRSPNGQAIERGRLVSDTDAYISTVAPTPFDPSGRNRDFRDRSLFRAHTQAVAYRSDGPMSIDGVGASVVARGKHLSVVNISGDQTLQEQPAMWCAVREAASGIERNFVLTGTDSVPVTGSYASGEGVKVARGGAVGLLVPDFTTSGTFALPVMLGGPIDTNPVHELAVAPDGTTWGLRNGAAPDRALVGVWDEYAGWRLSPLGAPGADLFPISKSATWVLGLKDARNRVVLRRWNDGTIDREIALDDFASSAADKRGGVFVMTRDGALSHIDAAGTNVALTHVATSPDTAFLIVPVSPTTTWIVNNAGGAQFWNGHTLEGRPGTGLPWTESPQPGIGLNFAQVLAWSSGPGTLWLSTVVESYGNLYTYSLRRFDGTRWTEVDRGLNMSSLGGVDTEHVWVVDHPNFESFGATSDGFSRVAFGTERGSTTSPRSAADRTHCALAPTQCGPSAATTCIDSPQVTCDAAPAERRLLAELEHVHKSVSGLGCARSAMSITNTALARCVKSM